MLSSKSNRSSTRKENVKLGVGFFFDEKGLHRALRVHRDAKRRHQSFPNATVPVSHAFPLNGKHVHVLLAFRFLKQSSAARQHPRWVRWDKEENAVRCHARHFPSLQKFTTCRAPRDVLQWRYTPRRIGLCSISDTAWISCHGVTSIKISR